MPQMAPMNWLFLFIMFSFIFLMINSMNYFSFMYNPKSHSTSKKKIQMNWKW